VTETTDLGFTRDGGDPADLVAFDSVDNTTFPDVGVADEPYRYLLFVRVQLCKLAKQLYKGTFAERVVW
jgi:hypothetical protein